MVPATPPVPQQKPSSQYETGFPSVDEDVTAAVEGCHGSGSFAQGASMPAAASGRYRIIDRGRDRAAKPGGALPGAAAVSARRAGKSDSRDMLMVGTVGRVTELGISGAPLLTARRVAGRATL